MVDRAVGQQVKLLLICAATATLLIAIFIGAQIGGEHYTDLVLGAIVLLAAITFLSGRFYWILTIASSFLGGTFPILGGQFTPFQILAFIGIAKFILEDVVVKRTRLKMGPRFDVLLIVAFMAVLAWHGIHDRFGMRFLGSSVWGGRHYVNVFVGLVAFVVIQSVPMPSKLWSRLPYAILAVTSFDLIIGIITTIFPASIYKIYPFYSGVSIAGVEEIVSGRSETGRIGAFGNFGFILILIVFSTVSLRSLLHPSNFGRLVLLGVGWLSVLYSGFRSMVLNSFLATFIVGIRDLKGRIAWLVVVLALFLAGVSIVNSAVVRLPRQIQRSLTFLPGEWDSEMLADAADSNQFRKQVWTTWERQYFPKHPWLGRGFGFKSEWAQGSIYKSDIYDSVWTVETGNIHNGFLASLDSMGIVGTLFFVIWNLRLLVRTLQVPFRRDDPNGMVLRFIALYLAVSIISYWIFAQDVGTFLSHELVLAGVFLRLQSDRAALEVPSAVTAPTSVAKLATPLRPGEPLDKAAPDAEITRLTSEKLEKSQFAHHPLDDQTVPTSVAKLATPLRPGEPLDQAAPDAEITHLTSEKLEKSQFAHHPLDDELAGKFLDRYLDTLDSQHIMFLQSDVDEFAHFKPTLAQAPRCDGDSSPARVIFQRYLERLDQRAAYVAELLRTEHFDFGADERYNFDRKNAARPGDFAAAQQLWRQQVRADYLQEKLV